MTPRRRAIAWLAGTAVTLAAGSAGTTEPTGAAVPSVSVVAARTGTLVERLTLTGTFVARDEAMVTPQIDGLAVTEILAEEGDRVAGGQVLARLSRDAITASLAENAASAARAQAAVSQAEGQIAEAQANRVEASTALGRATALLARGDLSHETFDQRQAASDVAEARRRAADDQLGVARADLALAVAQRQTLEVRLARTDLRAPVGGLVSRRMARLGAVVGTGSDPLFRIIANGIVEMEAAVPEAELVRLRAGQRSVLATTDGHLPGRIRLVSPEVNTTSRLGRVRIALDPGAARIVPPIGSFVRASVDVATRQGVIVPLSAVLFQPDGPVVEVVVPLAREAGVPLARGARVAARRVRIGLSDDAEAEIDRGVAPGEQVVGVSGTFLRDGDQVVAIPASSIPQGTD